VSYIEKHKSLEKDIMHYARCVVHGEEADQRAWMKNVTDLTGLKLNKVSNKRDWK